MAGQKNENALTKLREKFRKGSFRSTGGRRSIPIGMRLFLIFFASVVVFVAVVGMFSYQRSKMIIQDKVGEFSTLATTQTSDKLKMTYDKYEKIMLRFAVEDSFRAAFKKYDELPPGNGPGIAREEKDEALLDFTKLIRGSIFTDKYVHGVKLVLPDGRLLLSAGGKMLDAEALTKVKVAGFFSQEPWFNQAVERAGDLVWLDSKPDGVSGDAEPTFGMSRLVKDAATGKPAYVVLLEIKVNALEEQLQSLDLGDQGVKAIVNSNDIVIYSEQYELIGSPFHIPLPESNGVRLSEGNETFKDAEGDSHLVSYVRTIEGNDWYILTAVPVSELVRDARQILNVTLIILMIAVIVAILIGLYIVVTVGRPLVGLRNLMNEGEKGNLAVRANIRRKDEIGEVGRSFNQMMDQITLLVQRTSHSAEEVLSTAAQLSSVSQNTAIAAKEISAATEQIASGASDLAGEAEKGNDISIEIKVRMAEVVRFNSKMSQSAADLMEVSVNGADNMVHLIGKTNSTEAMTRALVDKVGKLKESTGSIRKILDLLENITNRTNILSLNATIEAVRAGAAGKGFMVVAEEIRKLADQSRQSITVVGDITVLIQSEVEETVQVLMEAYPLFQDQLLSVRETDLIFNRVREQMGELITDLDEVTQSIGELDKVQLELSESMSSVSAVSEEASATSEEVASLTAQQHEASHGLVVLSDKLEQLSSALKESLGRFTL